MIEINTQNLERAIAKARQTKPLVKVLEFRIYQVTNKITGATYTVKFSKIGNRKFAECDCKAIKVCYHIGAASGIHIVYAAQTVTT
jgi:hypothetical protein